ncbi:MAG: type II toxin-antitoxin system RelE/ParE family toxin [Candidatus Marsarchaeota archaeon]|nr:type II toxin-antitoxin system RelE/ParE family toxin [Candidatus Marsarchaeota archaeon]
MAYWTFFDFVDERGRNGVQEWIADLNRGVRQAVKAELNSRIVLLENLQKLDRPDTGQLRGKRNAGLFEIILKLNQVEYRPLWCYGPEAGEVVILTGTIEKGGKMPPPDLDRARRRKFLVMSDRSYMREHDFS